MSYPIEQRSAQYLAAISAATQDAIIILDNRGSIVFWGDAAESMFGYPRDEALGTQFHARMVPERFRAMHAQAFPTFQRTGQGGAIGRTLELVGLRKSGDEFPVELSLTASQIDGAWCGVGIVREITQRKKAEAALSESEARFRLLFESSRDALMTLEPPDWRFTSGNQAAVTMFGASSREDFCARTPGELSPVAQPSGRPSMDGAKEQIGRALEEGSAFFEWTHQRLNGEEFPATVLLTRLLHSDKPILQATVRDVSAAKRAEAELSHNRKLEAVGQLAAGIAHEINTPTQFVGDSVHFLKDAFDDCLQLIGRYRHAVAQLDPEQALRIMPELQQADAELDLPFLESNVPGSFESCVEGITRISTIVRAMKDFAHPDQSTRSYADLNQSLETTLTIAKNEYRYVADVETEFGALPLVPCHVGDLNQVFLNLIVNAASAIGEAVEQRGGRGKIRIKTFAEGDSVRIEIADTGTGIPEAIRHRLFDPFFTTKEVGKGSGQGLSVARSIVVKKHGGSLSFASELGAGTTFTIRLPVT